MSRPTTTTDLVKRLQSEVISKKERIALQALATEMFEVFREEKLLRLGHEAAALAVVASPERYRELLWAFANAIIEGTTDDNVLHPVLCKSLVHVLRCSIPRDTADPSTKVDSRLGTVLSSLKRRLESAVAQGDPNAEYQLVSTLGSVLHAMYDVQMVGIDRETVQKPLLDTLDTLSKDREIRLAQAATYAYEALRCLPDSEGPYKILLLKLVDVVGAVSKIAGAVATMDASKLFDGAVGLADVPDLVSAMVDVVKSISEAVGSLDAAKDVVSKQRKPKSWYVALRYGDMLIQNRAFAILKLFLDKVPCRQDIDFLCGLSAQLEQMWVQAAADDGAQARATRDHVQAVFASLPQPKSRSDPLHGVIGGASDNKKRWAAWKDAVARTMRSHTPQPNNDNKTKDYADTLHCYTVTFGSLPTGLLSKAWLRCTQAQRFYADTRLRKHYLAHDEYLLKIERLSGAWLPMQDCYINLKMIKTSKSNTSNETVPLHSLFDPCICKDGVMRVPRRLLIYGAAGVGKTTLCKKVVYELTRSPVSPEFQSWTAAYDRVIWLPLRNLTSHDPGKKYTLLDLFQAEYMHALQDGEVFARVLHDHCTASSDDDAKSSRTLFLLDGLDEVSQYLDANHRAAKFLLSLLSQPDVIITSRPGVRIPNRMRIPPLDCELETTGFNDYQVQQYVRHSLSDRQRVEAFLRFLHRHRLLSELVKIPLLLDALCYIWQDNNPNDNPNDNPDDDNPDNDNHATEAAQSIKTATAIYRAIEDKLWCKDIPRLEKYGPRGRITEDMVRGLRIREQIRELVHVEAAFLQQMAFSGLVSETVYFNERHCDNVLRHMDAPCLSGSVDDVLLHVSCLRTLQPSIASLDSMATTDRHRTYHFVHSTFQEYFAAQYFVGCWTAGTALAFVVSKDSARHVMGTDRFLAAHKYDARYSRFWRFVAGLLHNETDAPDTASLGRFFDALESEPRDIVGHEHQALVVQCLVEADPAQDMALFDAHRSRLKEWVAYDFDQWQTLRVLSLFSFPELISGPIVQDETGTITLSETRTLELLQSNFLREVPPDLCIIDASGRMPLATCKLLRKQPFLPVHVLQAITYRLRHSPIDRSHHSLDVLGQHLGDALPLILDCLRHTTGFVRANAATAFAGIACDRAALPPEAVAALVRCCTSDVFEGAACNAMVALCNVRPFPQDAIVVICDKLHDEKDSVRRAAAEAVRHARRLPVEIFLEITGRLLDPAPDVRSAAVKVFGARLEALPDAVLARLAQFLGSSSNAEKAAAIHILGRTPDNAWRMERIRSLRKGEARNTQHPVFEALIELLHNGPTPTIRGVAALAFRLTDGPLPAHIYQQLAVGLADQDFGVRGYTAVALCYHTTPLFPAVDDIVLGILSQAENFDNKLTQRVFNILPTTLPLSPATMDVLDQKLWDSTTARCIRTWILAVFQVQAGRLSEPTLQTLATPKQIQTLIKLQNIQIHTARHQVAEVNFATLRQITEIFGARQSLPESVLSSLLEQLPSSNGDGSLEVFSVAFITALSHRELVSRPVLTSILSCLTSSVTETRNKAESTLYRKSTLPLDILLPLLQHTVRAKRAVKFNERAKRIFEHMVARPDAELASLLQPNNGNARLLFDSCLCMANHQPVLCYADGDTHYAFVVGGHKRRVPKAYFPADPEDILRELGVPAGRHRVWDEIAEESAQGGKGEDGEKGDENDDGKYRSGYIFVTFTVIILWASFYVSFL